ncbi:MAG: hypothetical protein ABIR92_04700 [Gemmatimonadaceae bacterium]
MAAFPDGLRSDPLVPIAPAVQAKRRRFVRVVGSVALFGGAGLSAIPSNTTTWHESISTRETVQVHEMTFQREIGVPFRTVTVTTGPGRSIQRVGVHPTGLFGNVMAAALAMIAISLLRHRRRDLSS